MDWYAVSVSNQHERATHRYFSWLGYESFLPLCRAERRWADRVREMELPLFPGYVFCRFDVREKKAVLGAPGVQSIVGFGGEYARIPAEEVDAVRLMVGSGVDIRPWPGVEIGGKVRIGSGPLQGVTGVLTKFKDGWQVVVSVELLRRSVTAEVDVACVCSEPRPEGAVIR